MGMAEPATHVSTQVLVIGAGLAGLLAALAAREEGAEVTLVTKGRAGESGNSPRAGGGLAAALDLAGDGDTPDLHLQDTLAAGAWLNDRALVSTLTRQAPAAIRRLLALGACFDAEGGAIRGYAAGGHSRQRSIRGAGGGTARILGPVIRRVREAGISLQEEVVVERLLVSHGEVVGCMGIDLANGRPFSARAAATILAAGGMGQIFPLTSTHPHTTGDGYAMALHAGARLRDMEFIQFTPTALAAPPELRGTSTGGAMLAQPGVRLLNQAGERFMVRYDPRRLEASTRDILARAVHREIAAGRGTPNGGVYLDMTGVHPAAIRTIGGSTVMKLLAMGIDPARRPVEIAPAVHFTMGGVVIDAACQTDLPRLIAAGEAAGGVHGANRLSSNALTEAAVFGPIAGRTAARVARTPSPPLQGSPVEPIRWRKGAAADDAPLRARLRQVVFAAAGLERERDGLERGLAAVAALRAEAAALQPGTPAEAGRVIELRHMLTCAEVMMLAALHRQESRGAHYRSDYPQPDDARWLRSLAVRMGAAGPEVVSL